MIPKGLTRSWLNGSISCAGERRHPGPDGLPESGPSDHGPRLTASRHAQRRAMGDRSRGAAAPSALSRLPLSRRACRCARRRDTSALKALAHAITTTQRWLMLLEALHRSDRSGRLMRGYPHPSRHDPCGRHQWPQSRALGRSIVVVPFHTQGGDSPLVAACSLARRSRSCASFNSRFAWGNWLSFKILSSCCRTLEADPCPTFTRPA
jgi:hypothetical protein